MNQRYLYGLPPVSLNFISGGFFVFIVCLGVRVARAPEMELKIANTQLVVGSSADKLTELARQLDAQRETIEQKDEAYKQLQMTYEQYSKKIRPDANLKAAFEKVEELPEVQDIEQIQQEINQTEENLTEVLSE